MLLASILIEFELIFAIKKKARLLLYFRVLI